MAENMTLQASLSETTAGTDEDAYVVMPAGNEWKLEAAYFVPGANVTAHDTNYATLALKQGATSLASESTTTGDTGNLTAGTAIALAMTAGTGSSREFGAGDVCHVDVDKSGSGAALVGSVSLLFQKIVS